MLKGIFIILVTISVTFSQNKFKSANECGECHQEIYQEWQLSMHARATSLKDPLFNGMYQLAIKETEGKLKTKCVVCHSPMSTVINTIDMDHNFNQEGVTCQFCHATTHINGYQSAKNMELELDTVYSHHSDPDNSAHPSARREFFNKSDLCLPCHAVMKNPKDIDVCATGAEWKTFYETTQKTCQDCHMPSLNGYKSHLFAGTHRTNLLNNSIEMNLSHVDSSRQLIITLTNIGAGHAIPTGTPLRMVMLKVEAYDSIGEVVWENWKVNPIKENKTGLFMKILADAEGNGPVPPWRATQTIFEERLMPGKSTPVIYELPDADIYDIEAKLLYRFAPKKILDTLGITNPHFHNTRLIVQKGMKIYNRD
jgi:hypothetical protein